MAPFFIITNLFLLIDSNSVPVHEQLILTVAVMQEGAVQLKHELFLRRRIDWLLTRDTVLGSVLGTARPAGAIGVPCAVLAWTAWGALCAVRTVAGVVAIERAPTRALGCALAIGVDMQASVTKVCTTVGATSPRADVMAVMTSGPNHTSLAGRALLEALLRDEAILLRLDYHRGHDPLKRGHLLLRKAA